MKAFQISDKKIFMSKLLVKDTFDLFCLSEATISTGNTYQISGEINKEFYTSEEISTLPNDNYSLWSSVKPFVFSIIKGSKTPVYMKIVFLLTYESIEKIILDNNIPISSEDINGLFINIKYSENSLTIVTGTSIKTFTMDKSIDNAFDSWFKQYLILHEIAFEEI